MSRREVAISPHASAVPAQPADLTSRLISDAIGEAVEVRAVRRVGEEFGFSGESYLIDLAGGARPRVVAKLWALRDPGDTRELRFYRELAMQTPVPLPHFFHGAVDEASGRAWLVLEAIESFRQGDDLVEESAESVSNLVSTIAAVHAAWWGRTADRDWLPGAPRFRRDGEYLTSRRRAYLERFGRPGSEEAAALFDAIPRLVPVAAELLRDAPATLLHQDLGLDNVLFLPPNDKPMLIDWARCGRGAGVHDLGGVLFALAAERGFTVTLDHYRHTLGTRGIDVAESAMRAWLNGALIHRFITTTLGIARWSATTPRGLEILHQVVARTPQAVASWRAFDEAFFESLEL